MAAEAARERAHLPDAMRPVDPMAPQPPQLPQHLLAGAVVLRDACAIEREPWAAIPAAVLLICGGLLALVGSLGLLRMKDPHARMHPPAMGATLGEGCVLIASMLVSSASLQRMVIQELLITAFMLITTPVSAMTLMRAAVTRTQTRTDTH